MDTEKIVRGSVIHVMNYIVIELMRFGYKLAVKNELADLKDLINTNADKWMRPEANEETGLICLDDDLDLLEALDDAAVKRLMISIRRILKTVDTYALMSSPDIDELLEEEDLHDEAGGIFDAYSVELAEDGSYENVLDNLVMYYTAIYMLLWYCITQLELGRLEVYDEALQLSSDYYSSEGHEVSLKEPVSELLLELSEDLGRDSVLMEELSRGNFGLE